MTTLARMEALSREEKVGALFVKVFPFLLAGYMLFGKPFAYLHIPGTPIFIGEIVLATGLATALWAMGWHRIWAQTSVPAVMTVYVAWGLIRTIPGLLEDPLPALRDAVLWGYVLVAWSVVGALAIRPHLIGIWFRKYLRVMPFAVLWWPLTPVLAAMNVGTVPDSDVSITGFDYGMMQVQLAATMAFLWLVWRPETQKGLYWRTGLSAVGILSLLVMATRNRGGFLGAMIALAVVLLFNESKTKLIITAGRALLVAAVLVVVIDPRIDVGEREISAEQLSQNLASIVTLSGDQGALGSNISWRLEHWSDIFQGVNRHVPLAGHGFGPNIAEIYDIPQTDIGLRNAHNSHLTVLARAGWIGAILWVSLWVVWVAGLNHARKRLRDTGYGRLSGLCAWSLAAAAGFHVEAFFNPSIEGPQTAFWVWAIFGLGMYLTALSRPPRGARARTVWTLDPATVESQLAPLGTTLPR
ncbi:MAG TPA: O-antigen ligase family protein [Acidimicrobiia bacterium]